MTKIRVRVPATSANLGPGFDSFGLALALYNEVAISDWCDGAPEVLVHSPDASELSSGRDNIAWLAAHRLFTFVGQSHAPFRLELTNEIPLARGLGSSAAARVGALVAANEWARTNGWRSATTNELVTLATELEGHPDNAAAALLGGLTVAGVVDKASDGLGGPGQGGLNCALAVRMPVPRFPTFLVFSPDAELATSRARAILPEQVAHRDAVFNLSRASLLLAALASSDFTFLPEALHDRLHQSQRAALVPGWSQINAAATGAGAYGVTLSGAGTSMLLWLPADDSNVLTAVSAAIRSSSTAGTLRQLSVDSVGARLIPAE